MFGYIRVFPDELKMKEYSLYKHYYCELCRNIGVFSQVGRLFHSYDMVFYYMLFCSDIGYSACNEKKKKCIRCKACKGSAKSLFFAALSIALVYHKLDNDVTDGDRKKRFLRFIMKKGYKKTLKLFPNIGETIDSGLKKMLDFEKNQCTDYSYLSDFFGKIIYDAASGISDDTDEDKCRLETVSEISACVYLMDILDDREKDAKSGDYNPLNILGGGTAGEDECIKLSELVEKKLSHINSLINLLPYSDNTPVLHNISTYGMPLKLKAINKKHQKTD